MGKYWIFSYRILLSLNNSSKQEVNVKGCGMYSTQYFQLLEWYSRRKVKEVHIRHESLRVGICLQNSSDSWKCFQLTEVPCCERTVLHLGPWKADWFFWRLHLLRGCFSYFTQIVLST